MTFRILKFESNAAEIESNAAEVVSAALAFSPRPASTVVNWLAKPDFSLKIQRVFMQVPHHWSHAPHLAAWLGLVVFGLLYPPPAPQNK